jgi:hypothetical protein
MTADDDEYTQWLNDRNWRFHRTLVEFLVHSHQPETAAALLEGSIQVVESRRLGEPTDIYVEIPPAAWPLVSTSDEIQRSIRLAAGEVAKGHFSVDLNIELRMKFLDFPDDRWEEEMKSRIIQVKGSNQGLLSEMMAERNGRPVHTWNELKYASASEIRVAQELEKHRVLFFPLATAVRADTGKNWVDHREVDFLICQNGAWGILEVSYHPDRFEKDAEKDVWFKKSGILCIQHYTAERCYNETPRVVDEFLEILKRYEN